MFCTLTVAATFTAIIRPHHIELGVISIIPTLNQFSEICQFVTAGRYRLVIIRCPLHPFIRNIIRSLVRPTTWRITNEVCSSNRIRSDRGGTLGCQ